MGQPVSEEVMKEVNDVAAEAEQLRIKQLINEAAADGRKLVTVREISAIDDIPGADLIKVASVEGWKVVVKAGEFKPGDACVFFEVDSYLPMSDARFKFLEKNATNWEGIPGARLKTIRLRKQLSQGLALPLNLFPEIIPHIIVPDPVTYEPRLREDYRSVNLTGVLGIMKWEKQISAQLAGQAKGTFPSFLQKSDQERCQNMGAAIFGYEETFSPIDLTGIPQEAVDSMVSKGELRQVMPGQYMKVKAPQASRDTRYEVSIKLDGSSMTVYRHELGDEIVEGVCSRNLDLKMEGNEDNSFVKMANSGILEVLRHEKPGYALQGELMGPGIQGNREGFKADRYFVYNVFDIKAGEFMKPRERRAFIAELNSIARVKKIDVVIEHVPVLHFNITLPELDVKNIDELLKFAEGPSISNNVREGLVFKAMDGTHQFKAISNLFLEQEK